MTSRETQEYSTLHVICGVACVKLDICKLIITFNSSVKNFMHLACDYQMIKHNYHILYSFGDFSTYTLFNKI